MGHVSNHWAMDSKKAAIEGDWPYSADQLEKSHENSYFKILKVWEELEESFYNFLRLI